MSWNYRVIQDDDASGEPCHAIHEVYYDNDGTLIGYSAVPTPVVAFDGDGAKPLSWVLDRMREALAKPVLTPLDFEADNGTPDPDPTLTIVSPS